MRTLPLVILLASQLPVFAETGVTDKEIVIGSCSALSGSASQLGIQQLFGAKAYLNEINAKGGVNGRKIKLIEGDDRYEPDGAIECFNKTILGENVFAAAFFVGSPTGAKYAPMMESNKIPLTGMYTGAGFWHEPFKRYSISVRASYGDEARDHVEGARSAGMEKIGVIYQDDAFGVAVLEGVKKALKVHNQEPVAIGSFARGSLDVDKAIETVRAGKPDAVEIVGPYAPVAEIIKRARAKGWDPLFMTVSFVGTDAFIKAGGADVEGAVISQVVPPYTRKDLPAVAHYDRNMKKYFPKESLTWMGMEGFADAMVLVEGLKRAGKDLQREKYIEAIEAMSDVDLGFGRLKVEYSPQSHKAFHSVYDTVVRKGQAVIFKDWKELKK